MSRFKKWPFEPWLLPVVLIIIAALAYLGYLIYNKDAIVVSAQRQANTQAERQARADLIVGNTEFVKFPYNNDLCVGYVLAGIGKEVKHIYYAPCKTIPKDLLTMGVVKEKK